MLARESEPPWIIPHLRFLAGELDHLPNPGFHTGIDKIALRLHHAVVRRRDHQHPFDACVEAGVRQVIKFSGEESQVGYDPGRFRFTREHEQIEDYLEDSGLVWTHLRPSQFMQVYLREAMSMREKGGLFLALGGIRMSPVDLRDVAEIAAKLLAGGGHEGEALRITGPEALSMAEIAAIVGRVTGREVRYEPISVAERRRMLLDGRMPEWFVDAVTDQTEERLKHPEARVDLRTHELFGVKATRFEEFVRRHVEVFGG